MKLSNKRIIVSLRGSVFSIQWSWNCYVFKSKFSVNIYLYCSHSRHIIINIIVQILYPIKRVACGWCQVTFQHKKPIPVGFICFFVLTFCKNVSRSATIFKLVLLEIKTQFTPKAGPHVSMLKAFLVQSVVMNFHSNFWT